MEEEAEEQGGGYKRPLGRTRVVRQDKASKSGNGKNWAAVLMRDLFAFFFFGSRSGVFFLHRTYGCTTPNL